MNILPVALNETRIVGEPSASTAARDSADAMTGRTGAAEPGAKDLGNRSPANKSKLADNTPRARLAISNSKKGVKESL